MEIRKLVTLSFDRNVGSTDRLLRLLSGGALVGSSFHPALPLWTAILLGIAGGAWTLTGVLSKCSIYYLLGRSTCPVAERRLSWRAHPPVDVAHGSSPGSPPAATIASRATK